MDAKLPQTQMDKKPPFVSAIRVPESQVQSAWQVVSPLNTPSGANCGCWWRREHSWRREHRCLCPSLPQLAQEHLPHRLFPPVGTFLPLWVWLGFSCWQQESVNVTLWASQTRESSPPSVLCRPSLSCAEREECGPCHKHLPSNFVQKASPCLCRPTKRGFKGNQRKHSHERDRIRPLLPLLLNDSFAVSFCNSSYIFSLIWGWKDVWELAES